MSIAEKTIFKGEECVMLKAGGYTAVVAPKIGAGVLRLRQEDLNAEIFRYNDNVTMETINKAREIWGLPTLYLPNRFDGGILKTSDAVYQLPINEKELNNHLHGFVQNRAHNIEKLLADIGNDSAVLVTYYDYDDNDEFFEFFPVKFRISYTFTLSENGLKQEISLTNKSEKKLPVSICTHTCLNAPICGGGNEADMSLSVPIGLRCELDNRNLPTERLNELSDRDKEYKTGTKMPTLQDISNDMYTACMNKLDGEDFYGSYVTDNRTGVRVCNEVSHNFKFWNIWNDKGDKGYFCPEPMTAMINAPNLSLEREISGYKELSNGETFSCWQRFYAYRFKNNDEEK